MSLWNANSQEGDGDDDYAVGTELPPLTLRSSPSSGSDEGEASLSDSDHPYPLLARKQSLPNDQKLPDRLLRKQSTVQEERQSVIIQAVIDRIEDEVELHAYDDLVPLDIKLALEDKVFGWTHLTSSLIGHILFTGGAYWLTYQIVSIVYGHVAINQRTTWASMLRTLLCLWAALTTFRMVRRRRHVWFRSAYGSSAYKQDAARRRQQVAETDRTTALGRFVQTFRHRRVMSKLKRAESQFATKQKRQQESLKLRRSHSGSDLTESSSPLSERQRLLIRKESDFTNATSDTDSDMDFTSRETLGVIVVGTPLKRKHRRHSFNTKPTYRMHSYAHDEILMEEAIRIMPYAHGGFFGAAPFLLSNPHWISLLRHLMPDVYVEISRRVAINPPSRLIHWAENNPVVAAYGAAHALEQNCSDDVNDPTASSIPNLEWDVFLDPSLVRRVQLVLDQHADFRRQMPASDRSKEQSDSIEAYYQKELRRRSLQLVDKMLIAHGNALQLIVEQLGFGKDFNYSRVKRTRRTLGGGIYARQWMAVFAESLKLGVCHEDEDGEPSSPSKPATGGAKKIGSLFALAESSCPDSTIEESVRLVERITRTKNPIGLVLDIKSRHVPHHIWAIVVDTLRMAGVRVEGVASFCIDEIRDLSRFSTIGPIPGTIFCHSAGDVQQACHDGKIRNGDKIFFNAGCLLKNGALSSWSDLASFEPRRVKDSYIIEPCGLPKGHPSMGSCLQEYKERFNFHIGVYCQEFAIDEAAVQILVKLVNQNAALYDLGFSWGGINGITIKGIAPGRFTRTDGYWNQRHIGQSWNYDLRPPPPPTTASSRPLSQ